MNRIFLLVFCLLLLTHCQNDSLNARLESYSPAVPADKANQQDNDEYQIGSEDRRIIRTAEFRYQVADVAKSTEYIKNVVSTFQAFITQMNQSNSNYSIDNYFIIKTPSDKFESLLTALEEEAIFVNYKRIKSQDITEEFVDIEARLKTKREVRDRYIDILRNKAGDVKDILDAEEKIRIIQEEIEAKEGRLRYLQAQVNYSTIYLEIYQKVEYRTQPVVFKESFWGKIKTNFLQGWNALLSFLLFFVNIWPLLLIGLFLLWRRKRIFRYWRTRSKE